MNKRTYEWMMTVSENEKTDEKLPETAQLGEADIRRLQDDLCWKYLDCAARFDCRTLPGYRPQRLRMLQFACTPRRRAKAALFALSPELFRRGMNH